MSRCIAVKKDGEQCHARALRADLDGRCLFHSSINFDAKRRAGRNVTAEELVVTLGREIFIFRVLLLQMYTSREMIFLNLSWNLSLASPVFIFSNRLRRLV